MSSFDPYNLTHRGIFKKWKNCLKDLEYSICLQQGCQNGKNHNPCIRAYAIKITTLLLLRGRSDIHCLLLMRRGFVLESGYKQIKRLKFLWKAICFELHLCRLWLQVVELLQTRFAISINHQKKEKIRFRASQWLGKKCSNKKWRRTLIHRIYNTSNQNWLIVGDNLRRQQ